MSQEKRALLAGLLSLTILVGWYFLIGKKQMEQALPSAPSVTQAPAPTPAPSPSTPRRKSDEGSGGTGDIKPEVIVTKSTPLLTMEWTSRGGRPSKVILNRYSKTVEKNSPPIELLKNDEKAMVLACDRCNFSLPAETGYELVSQTDDSLLFQAAQGDMVIRKLYQWKPDQYLIHLKVTIENRSSTEMRGQLGMQWKADQIVEPEKKALSFLRGPGNQRAFLYKLGNKTLHDVKEEFAQSQGMIPWAGIKDRYFLISIISHRVSPYQILKLQKTDRSLDLVLTPSEIIVPPQGRQEESYSFYLGPKDREILQATGAGLEEAIDYGWFSILAVPILKLLQIFQSFVKNWGLAVILLTLLVKILMNPLTIKSMKQMKEMQKLQPRLAELKEKYKNDKQRLNMETMQLFKTHKVNPMGGCLPMLLQMPIYIALYNVLNNSIELYHAPFVGFYRDLSAPDPYFILPILLGIAMLLQQKLTPSASADPAQKQMMMIMPVMFTSFMLFLPLGLVLYIFVNTATGVLQQFMSQRDLGWGDVFRGKFKK